MIAGYVYKITNLINNKIYIGYTTKTPEERWKQHVQTAHGAGKDSNSLFKKAIRKYGPENFKIEPLEECDSIEKLKEREIYWISYYNSYAFKEGGYGYNSTPGGDGVHGYGTKGVKGYDILTGEEKYSYPSTAEAEFVHCRGIHESCSKKGEHTADGLVWFYADEVEGLSQDEITKLVHDRFPTLVYQLDLKTGAVVHLYRNTTEASEASQSSQGNIIEACLGNRRLAAGYQWCYQRDIDKRINHPVEELPVKGLSVNQYSLSGTLINTWQNIRTAANAINISESHISQVCNGKRQKAGGFQWRLADENIPSLPDIRKPKIKDLTTGEIFETINNAAKAYGISHATANKIANGIPSNKYPNIKLMLIYEEG